MNRLSLLLAITLCAPVYGKSPYVVIYSSKSCQEKMADGVLEGIIKSTETFFSVEYGLRGEGIINDFKCVPPESWIIRDIVASKTLTDGTEYTFSPLSCSEGLGSAGGCEEWTRDEAEALNAAHERRTHKELYIDPMPMPTVSMLEGCYKSDCNTCCPMSPGSSAVSCTAMWCGQ
jgi:hypothetical protein